MGTPPFSYSQQNNDNDDKQWWKESPSLFAGRFNVVAAYQGGMSEVLICKDKYKDKFIAAKATHLGKDLFSRESRLWLGLGEHPNIVKAHTILSCETFDSNYEQFLFMDFIGDEHGNSRNLTRGLLESQDKFQFIINTIDSVLNALEHARRIFPDFVHRDLKPDNILVDDSGNIFVTDFGIGHVRHENKKGKSPKGPEDPLIHGKTIFSEPGSFVGTYGYAAPEQYLDSLSVTFSSDVYSLGVILYEFLTGKLPYSPQMIRKEGYQYLSSPLPSFNNLSAKESLLMDMILKMLRYNPANRYSSPNEIRSELRNIATDKLNQSGKKIQTPMDKEVLFNRILSYGELNRPKLVEDQFFKYKKRYPFSFHNDELARVIFERFSNNQSKFLKKTIFADFTYPMRVIQSVGFLCIIYSSIVIGMQSASNSQVLITCILATVLYAENYINKISRLTLNIITLPGIILGAIVSSITIMFGHKTISGGFLFSVCGIVLGLLIPLSLSKLYTYFSKVEGLGMGTAKLSCMIGSWTGLFILPIIVIALVIMTVQIAICTVLSKIPGELKWSKNTLSPRLSKTFKAIPSSTALALATWIVMVFSFS